MEVQYVYNNFQIVRALHRDTERVMTYIGQVIATVMDKMTMYVQRLSMPTYGLYYHHQAVEIGKRQILKPIVQPHLVSVKILSPQIYTNETVI